LATAVRVLRQLRGDRRTLVLLLFVPCVLMTLLRYAFDDQPFVFDRIGPMLMALFPFTVMFVVTSVAMLRERTAGTLERLLTTPIARLDLLGGYALAFGLVALVQVAIVLTLTTTWLGLDITGNLAGLALIAELDALLGMALGLLCSAFARTEFQAVQFLPRWLSDIAPLTYAVDGATAFARSGVHSYAGSSDVLVVAAMIPVALALGAVTMRRRTS
jgi:ABC-2 type transport system permease protein